MRRRIPVAALLGAVSLLAAAREAAAWEPLNANAPRWGELPVGYYVNRSTIPSGIAGIAVDRIQAGFATWASPGCTAWQAEFLGDTSDQYDYRDGKNVLQWLSSSWPAALGDVRSVIGVTMPAMIGNIIVDADIVFNNVGFCWNDTGQGGCVDTQSIATHEEGHFLGLGHSSDRDATMAPHYVAGTSQRTLADDDIKGVCALYPADGSATTSAGTGAGGGGSSGGCESCTDNSLATGCRREFNACNASTACRGFVTCYAGCTDEACAKRCVDRQPAGAELYFRIIECICGECSTECSASCAGLEGSGGGGGAGGAGGAGGGGGGASVGDGGAGAGGASVSSASASGATSGSGGATTGGTTSSSAASGGGAGGEPPTSADSSGEAGGDSGCSCSTGGRSADLGGLVLLGVLGALASRRRRDQERLSKPPVARQAGAGVSRRCSSSPYFRRAPRRA